MLPSRRAVMFLSVALGTSIAMCGTVVASTSRADDVRGVVLNQTPPAHPLPGQRVRLEPVRGTVALRQVKDCRPDALGSR